MPQYSPLRIAWDNTDKVYLLECSVLFFSPFTLAWHDSWNNGTVDFAGSDESNYAGAIVKITDIEGPYEGQQRIWRLTGNRDKHGGYEGRWPD